MQFFPSSMNEVWMHSSSTAWSNPWKQPHQQYRISRPSVLWVQGSRSTFSGPLFLRS